MKRTVALLLLALCLSGCSSLPEDGGLLYSVARAEQSGGLCVYGPCQVSFEVLSDGRLLREDGSGEKSLGGVPSDQLEALKDAIREANRGELKTQPADFVCPDTYDGPRTKYSFFGGEEPVIGLDNCEFNTSEFPPVVILGEILENAF